MATKMSIEPQNNSKETCRVCLKGETLISIRKKHENVNIIEMLETCLAIQIADHIQLNENDDTPQQICLTCLSELSQAYKLSKKFQTTKIALDKDKPKPVAVIHTIEPNTNEDEFILPDKTIDRKDIKIGNKNDFVLIDKNIIKKIKDHNGRDELPSPSKGLTEAKMRIINSKSNLIEDEDDLIETNKPINNSKVVQKTPIRKSININNNNNNNKAGMKLNETSKLRQALTTKKTPGKVDNLKFKKKLESKITSTKQTNDKKETITNIEKPEIITNNKETNDKKETISNVENPEIISNNIQTDDDKNIEKLEIITNKQTDDHKIVEKPEITTTAIIKAPRIHHYKSKWNTRNKIIKNRNKKLKKKIRNDLVYSSAKYHEQFEKFLTTTNDDISEDKTDEKAAEDFPMKEEEHKVDVPVPKNEDKVEVFSSAQSNSNLKSLEIKDKIVTGYMRRFENNKECPLCKRCFKYLEPHLRIHSSKELASLRKINDTKEKIETKKKVQEIVKEVEDILFKCKYCERKFHHKNTLVAHEKNHEAPQKNQLKCPSCEKCFKDKRALQLHYNMHTKNNLYSCEICNNRSYNIKSNLYRHQRVCALQQKQDQDQSET